MNRHSVIVALALSALPVSALAQHDPALVEASDTLALPELPATPPALRDAVAALRADVASTEECYVADGRMEHAADPDCPRWYEHIARSGPAAVYAIGELFAPTVEDDGGMVEPLRGMNSELGRGPRLVQMMASAGRAEAVPFLLSYLVRTALHPALGANETDVAVLQALRALSGDDPAPTAPWEGDVDHLSSPLARQELALRWSGWFRDNQGRTLAEWRAAGVARAERRLTSEDVVERFSAIRRLAGVPAQRVAVTASLQALFGRADLPAAARVHLHRFARQRRIPLLAAPLVAAR